MATAAGTGAPQVAALVRETGDLGQAAERLLALPGSEGVGLAASLEVTEVVRTLREIAVAEGAGSQGRKLELLAGLLARATAGHALSPVHRALAELFLTARPAS